MTKRTLGRLALAVISGVLGLGTVGLGQQSGAVPAGSTSPVGPSATLGLGNGTAAYNPLINPLATPSAFSNNPDVLWYLYATRQYQAGAAARQGAVTGPSQGKPGPTPAPGPLVSPTRRAPSRTAVDPKKPATKAAKRPAALMPSEASLPGSSAAGFFYRGRGSADGTGKFYNRPLDSFQKNGR